MRSELAGTAKSRRLTTGVRDDGTVEVTSEAPAKEALPFADALPGAVLEVTKNGLLVAPERLLDLATYLKTRQGYDYLSMVTSVDWPDYFEVVYYLYGVAKPKDGLVLKVRLTDKANPEVPSVYSVWPGADFQEREVYDMMGIRFKGHPNLRRILLWEGFQGYPLRKDFREPYYEEETKPLKSRHPDGKHVWAEDRVPWHDNVQYPEAWDPDLWTQPQVQYRRIMGADEAMVGIGYPDRAGAGQHGAAAPEHARRVSHGRRARRRDGRRAGAGNGLPAPLPREDRRAQHLSDEHPVHRPARLHHLDVEQPGLCAWRSRS